MDLIVSINGPAWFNTFDSIFQILFAVVTLIIAAFSYKAYKLMQERKYKYFCAGFFMMSAGFFVISLSNLLIYTRFYDGIVTRLAEFNLANLFYMVHIFLMLLSYMLLLVIAMKLQQRRLIALLFAFILLFTVFSYQYYLKFHIISFMLLAFMAWQFYDNYKEKKNLNSGLVFSSFYMLAFAELFFLAMIFMPMLYVVGHAMQLIGFGLLLAMFMRVESLTKEKKKR